MAKGNLVKIGDIVDINKPDHLIYIKKRWSKNLEFWRMLYRQRAYWTIIKVCPSGDYVHIRLLDTQPDPVHSWTKVPTPFVRVLHPLQVLASQV